MSRILILSGIQLSTNPRVVKEANTLSAVGYDVEVVGATLDAKLLERDRRLVRDADWKYTVLVDASSRHWRDRFLWLRSRVRFRFFKELQARFGWSHPAQFGYVSGEMLRYALEHPADLVILHLPQALWVGTKLIQRQRRVAIDFEDWHSEEASVDDATYPRETLQAWERTVLCAAEYSTTTSRSLSEALQETYGCGAPAVVYNSFPLTSFRVADSQTEERHRSGTPSLCWFSQVIGPGRGLEILFDALKLVSVPLEIHLRGKCTTLYRASLLARAPEEWKTRVFFHDQIPEDELVSWLSEHDIGLAAELRFHRNKDLTVSNKILQYLLAGIAVIASDTKGHEEVAALAGGAVSLYGADAPEQLAATLDSFLGDVHGIQLSRRHARLAAERVFCWERSAPVLLQQVERVLQAVPGGHRVTPGSSETSLAL